MKILHEPKATVGQIVKDLELIVAKNPETTFSYSDFNDNENYITAAYLVDSSSVSENYGLVILAAELDEDKAVSAADLLESIKDFPVSAKVTVSGEWSLFPLTEDDGHYLYYDEENDWAYFSFDDCDVRLLTLTDLQEDMQRFAEKYPDCKVVALGNNDKVMKITSIWEHDGEAFLTCAKDGGTATVASFMNEKFYHKETGIAVAGLDEYDDSVYSSIQVADDGTIFFEYKIDGEAVIACRLGEVLMNNADDFVAWQDLCGYDYPKKRRRLYDDDEDDLMNDDDVEKYVDSNEIGHILEGATKIDKRAFADCTNLTSIEIPDSVTEIGGYAFVGCTNLTSIKIPDSVTKIGDGAFKYCRGLTGIEIPASVMRLGSEAFYGCTALKSIEIPDSVTNICEFTFMRCRNLKSIKIPGILTDIDCGAFRCCTSLTNIEIPDSVTWIGPDAFSGCTGLKGIKISDSVTEIGEGAFEGCTGLTGIKIPDSVTEIGEGAFKGCTGITGIQIPDSVAEIGEGAFKGCTGLTSIEVSEENPNFRSEGNCLLSKDGTRLITGCYTSKIPASVTEIGEGAFKGCTGLTSIKIPASVIEIGSAVFAGCTGLASIEVSEENPNFRSEGNCLLSKDGTKLILGCYTSKIPDSVKMIKDFAFNGCTGLTSIKIPDNVEEIDDDAFYGCTSLTGIEISEELDIEFAFDVNIVRRQKSQK